VEFLNPEIHNRSTAGHGHLKSEELKQTLVNHTVTLSEILQRTVTFEEVAECVKQGFELEWGIEFSHESGSSAIGSSL